MTKKDCEAYTQNFYYRFLEVINLTFLYEMGIIVLLKRLFGHWDSTCQIRIDS